MNMNITPQDILLSALLMTITAALLATVHAVTEEAYDAIAEALEILREALSTPNLIPFQFGYAVNVISESYIVIPAKAGIHTGWLGRTW